MDANGCKGFSLDPRLHDYPFGVQKMVCKTNQLMDEEYLW